MQLQLIASPRRFLHVLLWLRVCAVIGQSITIAVIQRWLGIELPVAAMGGVIAGLAAVALLTGLRLRTSVPATELEVAVQLVIDIAELTALLYLSGGTTNPFASLYLIPVALAAVGLAWQYTLVITVACLGCYGYLIDHSTTLGVMHAGLASAFDLHLAAMHVMFAIGAVLLAVALSMMAAEMRRRDQAMATLREEMMRKEHLSAMGVLAAGAAHELSTPLLSMTLLVSELRAARRMDAQVRDDLALLEKQIEICKHKLTALLEAARVSRGPNRRAAPIQALVQEVLDKWSIVRPTVRLEVDWRGVDGNLPVDVDEGFSQALVSLLDNAAEASESMSSNLVRLAVTGDARGIRLYIDDEGPGLSAEALRRAGKAIFTTKKDGFGLGLALSHANLDRLDGDLTLTRRPGGGTRTTISLPTCAEQAGSGDG